MSCKHRAVYDRIKPDMGSFPPSCTCEDCNTTVAIKWIPYLIAPDICNCSCHEKEEKCDCEKYSCLNAGRISLSCPCECHKSQNPPNGEEEKPFWKGNKRRKGTEHLTYTTKDADCFGGEGGPECSNARHHRINVRECHDAKRTEESPTGSGEHWCSDCGLPVSEPKVDVECVTRKEFSELRLRDVMENKKHWDALMVFLEYHFHTKRGMKELRDTFKHDQAEI